MYIARSLEPALLRSAREFPVVVLTGPRQSGKTTTLKRLFGSRCGYCAMDLPDLKAAATTDPRGFLDQYATPVILDEIQSAPGLLPYIKARVDAQRTRKGRYFLTGSQNLALARGVTESLAGRAAVMRLLPLSRREQAGKPLAPLPWEKGWRPSAEGLNGPALWKRIYRGGYPELVREERRDIRRWHAGYVQTYLERDIRSLRQVGDMVTFQNFVRALALRSGQLLNLADIGRDLGIALNTAKGWLSVLVATHQVIILTPYFTNIGKRLIKTPKVYFTDTGTMSWLLGIEDPAQAAKGPLAGPLFEAAVVGEVVKAVTNRGEEPRLHFWRTRKGEEVDLIVETAGRLVPLEAKASSTPRPGMAAGIASFRRMLGPKAAPGYVVHGGSVRLPVVPGVTAIPFSDL
jgi:predicted AAA+ superfamily ATPase